MIMLLSAFFIIFIPSAAIAQTDSVSAARKAIEEFHAEATEAVKALQGGGDFMDDQSFIDMKKKTLKELDVIRWSQEPGERRHRRVMSVFEAYMSEATIGIKEASSKLPGMGGAKLDGFMEKISAIKKRKTLSVKESLKAEVYRDAPPKPVPSVDRPPRERNTEGGADIWDR